MAVPGRAQLADRRQPGRPGTTDDRACAAGRRCQDRFGTGPDPGPATRFRRTPAPVACAPERARGDLLRRRDAGDGRPPARHTARPGQITPALCPAGLAPPPPTPPPPPALLNTPLPWHT